VTSEKWVEGLGLLARRYNQIGNSLCPKIIRARHPRVSLCAKAIGELCIRLDRNRDTRRDVMVSLIKRTEGDPASVGRMQSAILAIAGAQLFHEGGGDANGNFSSPNSAAHPRKRRIASALRLLRSEAPEYLKMYTKCELHHIVNRE
jgi:hypothetical protein